MVSQKIRLMVVVIGLATLYSCTITPEKNYESTVLFNKNWEFKIDSGNTRSDADTVWKKVALPHTPRIEPMIVKDQWQGICRYRKDFIVPDEYKGKLLFLKFEGAMNVAEVWVNGQKLIRHLGGYLPFTVDFTDVARFGEKNTVEVRLDNTDNPITGPKPLNLLDFNTYGGIYRDVYLIVKNPLHITDPISADKIGGGGIFVTYPLVTKDEAIVQVKTDAKNSGRSIRSFFVRNSLIKNDLTVASSESEELKLHPGEDKEVIVKLRVQNPLLWSPNTPVQYTLQTRIISDRTISDGKDIKIGIHRFEFSGDEFRINGEKMFLRGVNRHQEYPYIGYALSDEAQYRDARKIKEAGFDYVRLSHYPQDPAFLDACDELGLLVLDAIPGWQYFNEDKRFQEHAWQTCKDMIRRDRNHPCVLAWEVSLNETWMPESFIDSAVSIAHKEYPGDQCYTAGWQKYGYDIYLQARQHRLQHYKKPDKPYIVSEYGDWEYFAMNAGLNQNNWSDLLQEERSSRQLLGSGEKRLLQQVRNIQEAHNDNLNTPAFADGYWAMFDYNRGYADDLEASGIMSINRLPKFSYYFFRSQRDPDIVSDIYEAGPMVFIASYWTEKSNTDVKVFSNCDEVDLYLNDKLIERRKPDKDRISGNLRHPPFTFRLENFVPGTLKAIGYIDGKEVANQTVTTPEKPVKLGITRDDSGKPPKSGVNDVIFVYANLLDENNTVVPENGVQVDFTVKGGAEVINKGTVTTEAGIATALVRIGNSPGSFTIKANVIGIPPAEAEIRIEQ